MKRDLQNTNVDLFENEKYISFSDIESLMFYAKDENKTNMAGYFNYWGTTTPFYFKDYLDIQQFINERGIL